MHKNVAQLTAMRGIAALVVFLQHFLLCFAPRISGNLYPDTPWSLVRTPAFAFINGGAAVAFFFVLSGFVLSIAFFDSGRTQRLAVPVLKRCPRLAGLVLVTTALSGLIAVSGGYANSGVDSLWLRGLMPGHSFSDALSDGLYGTLWLGRVGYNMAAWSMQYEMIGSALVFATLLIVRYFNPKHSVPIILSALAVSYLYDPLYAAFPLGVMLALAHSKNMLWWPRRMAAVVCFASILLVLFGYGESVGFYAFLPKLTGWSASAMRTTMHAVAAAMLIICALKNKRMAAFLNRPLLLFLGRVSFPLYLIHLILMASIGSAIYLFALPGGDVVAVMTAFMVTTAATFLISWPLAILDERWTSLCGLFARAVVNSVSFWNKPLRNSVNFDCPRGDISARK